jgi:hypothetical protein
VKGLSEAVRLLCEHGAVVAQPMPQTLDHGTAVARCGPRGTLCTRFVRQPSATRALQHAPRMHHATHAHQTLYCAGPNPLRKAAPCCWLQRSRCRRCSRCSRPHRMSSCSQPPPRSSSIRQRPPLRSTPEYRCVL